MALWRESGKKVGSSVFGILLIEGGFESFEPFGAEASDERFAQESEDADVEAAATFAGGGANGPTVIVEGEA
jgi:hypothetical protein